MQQTDYQGNTQNSEGKLRRLRRNFMVIESA